MARQIPLLRKSDLTGAIYIVTRYREVEGKDQIIAEEKFDVTDDFAVILADSARKGWRTASNSVRREIMRGVQADMDASSDNPPYTEEG